MISFIFQEKCLEILSLPYFMNGFPRKMLLMLKPISHVSLSDCIHFFWYWAISALKLFVSQGVTS